MQSSSDDSLTDFVASINVLISSSKQLIIEGTLRLLDRLSAKSSPQIQLKLVSIDLVPQIITSLSQQSLSFVDPVDIHTRLINVVKSGLQLATPRGLDRLADGHPFERQAVHKTVLEHVLVPSEEYLRRMSTNRFILADGDLADDFVDLLALILRISPFSQPTVDLLPQLSIFLTIPSCLTVFDFDLPFWSFLGVMVLSQEDWNKQGGNVRRSGATIFRCLRTEGLDDVLEQRLQNDLNGNIGEDLADYLIKLNAMLGMNV
ncbi:hypothetical protein BLNAU_6126 [Blattamonas nauphoetae]|uniref:DNA mismatch repair protein HSM3 N-terminal domain-containing protein n=1 Tax=Blattamonas nauphoetae TaxID=2049346 RepID=A0ABQ9Y549_9EUKA|nr:hypothetical protein BLNAU_6126 [Blattamonas nauphoetae]